MGHFWGAAFRLGHFGVQGFGLGCTVSVRAFLGFRVEVGALSAVWFRVLHFWVLESAVFGIRLGM